MAPPGINLITTVASRLYALAPAPPAGLRFHSAPLPSPEGGASSASRLGEYPFERQGTTTINEGGDWPGGGQTGCTPAAAAAAQRLEPTQAAESSSTVGGSPWDDDAGDVSSEGTARQRSTERPGAHFEQKEQARPAPTAATEAGARWRRDGSGNSSHGSRASSFRSVQDGLFKAEQDAEERDEVRALHVADDNDGEDDDDNDGRSDDSGESDDDCVVLVQSPSLAFERLLVLS